MKQEKVLFVDLAYPFGGIESYLVSLAQLLKGQAEMLAICVNMRLAMSLSDKCVRVVPKRGMKDRGKLLNIVMAAALLVWMRLRCGISIVWINGNSEIVLLPIAKLLGCKALATRHLTMELQTKEWHSHPSRKGAQRLYKFLAFTADRIFCVSGRVASDIVRIVAAEKVKVISNWVPEIPSKVHSVANRGMKLKLLFVGRLERYKGASLILEAMHGLGQAVCLTIVGDGPYRGELEREAAGLDVHFAGFQADTREYYRQADIFINPSMGPEGLPLVSLEAMSFGLPCIFSDLDVHREITGEGNCAALFGWQCLRTSHRTC